MHHFIIENAILEVFIHLSNSYGAPNMPALEKDRYVCLDLDTNYLLTS